MTSTARLWPRFRARPFSTSSPRRDTYAFIGLGQMGSPMARKLQAKLAPTDTVRIFDISRAAVDTLAREMRSQRAGGGAAVHVANSAQQASQDADTVITCLPEPQHVQATFGALLSAAAAPGPSGARLYIDCSTIDPSTSRAVAAQVSAHSPAHHFVDAPMSGGVVGATAGTLTFMLGAPAPLVPRVEPVLLRMGRRVLHCGPQGAGLAAKLANNYLLAVTNIATAEAMNLGVRWGLDPGVLAGVLNASTGRCWPSEVNNPVPGVVEGAPAGRDYQGGFGIGLMQKDVRLARVAAAEAGARLELGESVADVYDAAGREARCQGRDFSVVYRYLGGRE